MFHIVYICCLFMLGFNLCLCFEEAWVEYQNILRYANREELVITNVTTDENYILDVDVKKWRSLSVGSDCYSVGLMDTGLVILFTKLKNSKFDIQSTVKELNKKPVDVFLLENRNAETVEAFVVVAYEGELTLEWYKFRETKLELFWTWNLDQPVVHINGFAVNDKSVLLLAKNFKSNSTLVDLYHYDLKKNRHWFWHSLDVSSPVSSSAFNDFEFDSYISLAQKSLNKVIIFKNEDSGFVPYETIPGSNVETVVSFEIGFQSFLAIDGDDAGIYQFKRYGVEREDILNSNLDWIEYWIPVPVKTYRDDLILFAQRNINHTSHNTYILEIFTYNGVKFEEHEDIPCSNFGENTQSGTCLREGIIGSSFIAVEDRVGLIIPMSTDKIHSPSSFLFMINFTIKDIPNPIEMQLKQFCDQKEKLQNVIDTEIREYDELRNLSQSFEVVDGESHQDLLARQSENKHDFSSKELEALALSIEDMKDRVEKIVENENMTEFDIITINGVVEVQGESKFKEILVKNVNGQPVDEILEDIVSKDSIGKITGDKTIGKLDVHQIMFENVNGINAKDIVFNTNSAINIKGKVTVQGPANVENVKLLTSQVNGVNLADMVDMRNDYNGTLQFENVKVNDNFQMETLNGLHLHSNNTVISDVDVQLNLDQDTIILENLTVTNINGDDFDIFIKQLCLINLKCYIPGDLKINGDIIANRGTVSYLNGLKFPDEFVLTKPDRIPVVITGNKTFRNSLVAKEIRPAGKIDGVDTKKLITLSSNQQEILGKITFKDIEVAEQLNVTGNILGDHVEKFLPNPTLKLVNNISANVNFKKIEVDGNIIIENNLNRNNFQTVLKDLVYKDEGEVNIIAQKDIPEGFTVMDNLEIESNTINNISLESFVTTNTDQILNISFLKGNVTIENLLIEGHFDGQNVTELDQNLIKLTGEQHISSTLIFSDHLEVENIEVTESFKNMTLEEFMYEDTEPESYYDISFQDVNVENVTIQGNFTGNIAGVDLIQFNESYLSYSKDQVIDKHYDIIFSSVDDLKADRINSENYEDYFDKEKLAEEIVGLLNSGQLKIGDLYVHGPLYIDSLNDKDQNDWLPKNLLQESDGKYKKNLVIEGNVYFKSLEINNLSSINWNWFNKQIIRKEEVSTHIQAPSKNFLRGIKVAKLIETKKLNGIPIEDILTKQGDQIISGPITIKGDVVFKEKVKISKNLNDVDIREILDNVEIENDTYHIKGDVFFSRLPYILNLTAEGFANNKDTTEHLSWVVHLDEDTTFEEQIVFEDIVHISGNLAIEHNINGIDLSDVASQIVLITKDTEIQGPVTFSQPVVITDHLNVEGNLNTETLYGINFNKWKNEAIFLDKGMVEGTYEFQDVIINDSLVIKYLNEMNVNSIILLKEDQNIDYMEIEEVTPTKDIPVFGVVNGYSNLSEEFNITVLIDKDQKINTNVLFKNIILVRENLFTDFINGEEASQIVTTDTDQNLTATFNFKSQSKMEGDLQVHGLVDGVNLTAWKKRHIKIYSQQVQDVYYDWNISENITFARDVEGDGLINDLNLTEVTNLVEDRKKFKYKVEHGIIEDYKQICFDVSYLYKGLKKQIYKFKYFEELCTITFNSQIENTHYFEFRNKHYLLVSKDDCSSQLLVFNNSTFEVLSTLNMGHVSQTVAVQGEQNIYLVSTDDELKKDCAVSGTNVWSFNGSALELHYNIEKQDLLQESLIPFTFYGLNKQEIIEFKVTYNNPTKHRKWKVSEENAAFVPRGLKTGLCLRTGSKIVFLDQTDPVVDDFNPDMETVVIGNTKEIVNDFMPGRKGGDLVITRVGTRSNRRNFLAVASHEETSVKGRLDFVKIYSDVLKGEIFHKVPAYKPSSLLSVEFDQGETLLVFLENEKTLQVYEYKGIEGFKHRSSAKVEGSKLFLMTLPIKYNLNPRKVIGIVHENKISMLQSVMAGNQIRDGLKCGL